MGIWAKLKALSRLESAAIFVTFGALVCVVPGHSAEKQTLPSFRDITDEAGLAYKITCGDPVTKSLLDVNGQGACFLDYDGDGRLDIYLVNGSSRSLDLAGNPPHDYLLKNRGDGTFADVTKGTGLGDTNWSSGRAVGDYDNDSDPDLYLTNYGPNKLYRNDNHFGTDEFLRFCELIDAAGIPHDRAPQLPHFFDDVVAEAVFVGERRVRFVDAAVDGAAEMFEEGSHEPRVHGRDFSRSVDNHLGRAARLRLPAADEQRGERGRGGKNVLNKVASVGLRHGLERLQRTARAPVHYAAHKKVRYVAAAEGGNRQRTSPG